MAATTTGRRRALAVVLLGLAVAFVLSVTIGSRPQAVVKWSWRLSIESRGRLEYREARALLELGLNVALFVPLGVAVGLLARRSTWLLATGAGFAVSVAVELAQALFLPERTPQVVDVATNTLGALLGAVAVTVVRAVHRRHTERGATLRPQR